MKWHAWFWPGKSAGLWVQPANKLMLLHEAILMNNFLVLILRITLLVSSSFSKWQWIIWSANFVLKSDLVIETCFITVHYTPLAIRIIQYMNIAGKRSLWQVAYNALLYCYIKKGHLSLFQIIMNQHKTRYQKNFLNIISLTNFWDNN